MVITAFGGLLIVVAVAYFSLTGSGFGGGFLSGASGLALGMVLASLLTRSPRRGRLIAASLLALLVVGVVMLVLGAPGSIAAFSEDHTGWARFIVGLVGAMAGVALMRLLGPNLLGPRREDRGQPSRQRS